MKLSNEFLDAISLKESAKECVSRSLLQMPLLISERALADATDLLAEHAHAVAQRGFVPGMEVIAMPKKGYGPRPIGVLSPVTRTLFHAIVDRLDGGLPEPSRAQTIAVHNAFGVAADRPDTERIVDLDIAACYEYIDHQILADELLLQTMDPAGVDALTAVLSDLFPRNVGLPQALEASHRLADAYLDRMQRGLLRSGYEVNRYADDFKIVTEGWADAHRAIELAVEQARAIGLTLSDSKTFVRSAAQLRTLDEERQAMLNDYKQRAADDLRSIEAVQTAYDDFELEEVEASPEEVDFAALQQIVEDWVKGDRESRSHHSYFGSQALRALRKAPERLPDEWLLEVVRREPARLRAVLVYVLGRSETAGNWTTLVELTKLDRLSPWSRLWLLRAAEEAKPFAGTAQKEFLEWAVDCVDDKYEVVRADAAWLLAGIGQVSQDQIAGLFVEASQVTQIGIAAVAGRRDGKSPSKLGNAIRAESKLARAAYEWGTRHAN